MHCSECQTKAIRRMTPQGKVTSTCFHSSKLVFYLCHHSEGLTGAGTGETCYSPSLEGDVALILPGEYRRLRNLSPPQASQVVRMQGRDHVWIFGRVNGHLVAIEAVLDGHLGGATELVLGLSALRQLNAARQKTEGSEEDTTDLTSKWYHRIGHCPWLLQGTPTANGLVHPIVQVRTEQNTLISASLYRMLHDVGRAGPLRLAGPADHESARVDAAKNGHRCVGGIPYPQTTMILIINGVAVAIATSVVPSGGTNIRLGRIAMDTIELDVPPAPMTEASHPTEDMKNLSQMTMVLLKYCAQENPTLSSYPERMAVIQSEMQRRRRNKADTRSFLTWLRTVATASCTRPYCPNWTASGYCCRSCAHQHRDAVDGVIRGGSCKNPRCRGLKRGKLLASELKEGQIPEFFDFCGLSCRNSFVAQDRDSTVE